MIRASDCLVRAIVWLGMAGSFAFGQTSLSQRSLATNLKDPVILNVDLSGGNVRIGYRRDDQVAIYASGKDAAGKNLPEEFFKGNLIVEQKENQVWLRDSQQVNGGGKRIAMRSVKGSIIIQ